MPSLRWVRCWVGKYYTRPYQATYSRQPGAISPMGRYHVGMVKDVLVHTIWKVNTHLEGKLLPPGEEGENDVERLEDDSDVEFLGGGGKEGDIAG